MKYSFLSLTFASMVVAGFNTMAHASLWSDQLLPFKLGVTVGLNASDFAGSSVIAYDFNGSYLGNLDYQPKCGFNVGVNAMFDMTQVLDNTFLRVELLLSRKGARYEDMYKYRPLYLELPIHYGYGVVLNPQWAVFGETGPYFALGLGGKSTYEYKVDNRNLQVSSKFFDDAKRFDMGWGWHVGVIFEKIHQLSMGYDLGFIDLSNDFGYNRNFSVSYTYYFK